MSDFQKDVLVRLDIGRGRWIDVKKRLNAGESRKMYARMMLPMNQEQRAVRLDPEQLSVSRVVFYLVDWNLTDDGVPMPCTEANVDRLTASTYAEIVDAIDQHCAAEEVLADAEKNVPAGENDSSTISPVLV